MTAKLKPSDDIFKTSRGSPADQYAYLHADGGIEIEAATADGKWFYCYLPAEITVPLLEQHGELS